MQQHLDPPILLNSYRSTVKYSDVSGQAFCVPSLALFDQTLRLLPFGFGYCCGPCQVLINVSLIFSTKTTADMPTTHHCPRNSKGGCRKLVSVPGTGTVFRPEHRTYCRTHPKHILLKIRPYTQCQGAKDAKEKERLDKERAGKEKKRLDWEKKEEEKINRVRMEAWGVGGFWLWIRFLLVTTWGFLWVS